MSEDPEAGLSWKTYVLVVACFVVPLALLVPLPAVMDHPDANHGALAGVGLVLGLVGAAGARQNYAKIQLVRDTPTSKVRSLAVGAAEVKGEAYPREGEDPLTSPMSHKDACLYRFEVEEYHEDEGRRSGGTWRTVLSLSDEVPFEVDDGTGTVAVDPEGPELAVEVERKERVDEGDDPPPEVGEWAARQGMVDEPEEPDHEGITGFVRETWGDATASKAERALVRSIGRDRRYTERVLEVGEETYVFGGAYPREGAGSARNPENLVLREHEGTGRFIVGDQPEAALIEGYVGAAAVSIALVLVGFPYGLVALGTWLGLL